MARIRTNAGEPEPAVSQDDLLRLVGDIDERRVFDILALNPTIAELGQAALWAAGDGDILAKGSHPLSGRAAEILEILATDDEEEKSQSR